MTKRAFTVSLFSLAAVIWLSATPGPGGMLGVLIMLAFVFFVGVPVAIVAASVKQTELPPSGQLAWILGGLYALIVIAKAVQAWRLFARRDLDKARSAAFGVAVLLALPLIGWLSVHAIH
jgi:hypothetical protein